MLGWKGAVAVVVVVMQGREGAMGNGVGGWESMGPGVGCRAGSRSSIWPHLPRCVGVPCRVCPKMPL
jgi:hypothetical protein